MQQPTISLCMIVKNEEKHLARCLQSVQMAVDEIIVVDTGSTDHTIEIAQQFGARVFSFAWIDDFSAARNFSLQQSRCEYALILDADEYFEEEVDLKQEIASRCDYYQVRFKNVLENVVVFHNAIRIIRNNRGLHYISRIHEHINIEEVADLTYGTLTPYITHLGYMASTYQEKNKHQRNYTLLKQAIRENPSGFNYFNLGKQYKSNREFDKALQAYQTAFHKSKDRTFITILLTDMIDCLRLLHRYEEAVQVAFDAIASFPLHTDMHYTLGRVYEEMGYWEDAVLCYQKCLELGEPQLTETVEGVGSYLAHLKLGELYLQEYRNMDAFEEIVQALHIKKQLLAGIELFLRTLTRTRVSLEDIYSNMQGVYSFASAQDVTNLITVLYVLRHPLLHHYVNDFQLNTDTKLRTVSNLYGKKYTQARADWLSVPTIEPERAEDVLLLAILLQDTDLYARCQNVINMTQKERKVLAKIVKREKIESADVSKDVSKLLLTVCERLIVLQEFAVFDEVTAYLMGATAGVKCQMADLLCTYGYVEGALQLLLQTAQQEPRHSDVYRRIGDLCLRRNQPMEALGMYGKVLDHNQHDLHLYANIYKAYQQLQDSQGAQQIRQEMKRRFPLSQWVAQLS